MLKFDAEKHEYRYDGAIVPNVTEALKDLGFIDADHYTEYGRQRGTLVHTLCQYHDEGDLDPQSVDPKLAGYLKSWTEFLRITGAKVKEVERRGYHPLYRYAGTMDRILDWLGRLWVVDLKTGKPEAWHPFQTAAYTIILPPALAYKRGGVYLKEDGSLADFVPHDDLDDGAHFLNILSVHHLRRHYGLNRPKS